MPAIGEHFANTTARGPPISINAAVRSETNRTLRPWSNRRSTRPRYRYVRAVNHQATGYRLPTQAAVPALNRREG